MSRTVHIRTEAGHGQLRSTPPVEVEYDLEVHRKERPGKPIADHVYGHLHGDSNAAESALLAAVDSGAAVPLSLANGRQVQVTVLETPDGSRQWPVRVVGGVDELIAAPAARAAGARAVLGIAEATGSNKRSTR